MSAHKALAYDTPFVSQVNPNIILNPGHPLYVLRNNDDGTQSILAVRGNHSIFPRNEQERKADTLMKKIQFLSENDNKVFEEPTQATVENSSVIQAIVQP